MERIPAEEAHVWLAHEDEIREPQLLEAYRELMTAEEAERHRRFLFDRDRHQFLITRALVRTTLGHYTGLSPRALRFAVNEYGRPALDPPTEPPLRFNLSNTRGLVVCALSHTFSIGVDVEAIDRGPSIMDLVERVFSPGERADLARLPPEDQPRRCVELWTLKESYIKARGMGLAIPLRDFTMRFGAGGWVSMECDLDDVASHWQFWLSQHGRFQLAMAVRRGTGQDLSVHTRTVVPVVR